MYILTDGLNYGAARLIGEAVAQEKMRHGMGSQDEAGLGSSKLGHITAIGVMASDQLSYGQLIEETSSTKDENVVLVLENVGDEKHELNPHHSHSIILSCAEPADKEAVQNTVFSMDTRLPELLYSQLRERKTVKRESSQIHDALGLQLREKSSIPVVGLMLHGGPAEIDRVLWLLKKQVPVVVIIRQATASGLLAYAFKEYLRGDGSRVDQILKPQLMSRVQETFPEYCGDSELLRQQVRDRILDCVKVASQSDRQILFLLDPNNPAEDLKDLNKFILAAILTVRRGTEGLTKESINWTLRLALRWNRVDFVAKNILNPNFISRFRVRDDIFVEALLLRDREPFVELFLSMGFLLQRLMTYEQVLKLFEASLNEEFFVTICLKNILRKKEVDLGTRFMHEKNCELNRLLCMLSGLTGLVEPSHLLLPQTSKTNKHILERRALLTILYWAVLTNRKNLVKVLWERSADPIAVGLVISNMYYRMSKYYIQDIDLRSEIKQNAIEFGALAIKIMDLTFNDSPLLAFHSLTNPIPEFNNLNVVDLALIGNNIFFIAHPCCQRSMRERWFGNIKIKSYGSTLFNKFPTMDMMWPLLEFLAEVSTAAVLLLHLLGEYLSFMTYKFLMALSLLVVYFSAMRGMLTASPDLGPMLVNVTELIRKDMINWLQLWLMWVISGGLAIQSVIYPAQPFSLDILGRALLRAILGIWLTEIDDLDGRAEDSLRSNIFYLSC
ncbi:transient receptor potential cation channel subfamily M member 2 [Elysia marginata]|uniref:Transient receptor potential cation channel subfamily M member 2 n=1 Tax=Elysia marginata TaxID=1093978 RepID=A0AAV4JVW5_9GAST|nr:transient receptor potential cation channel subfamily M member 2 [Elysia marginata]